MEILGSFLIVLGYILTGAILLFVAVMLISVVVWGLWIIRYFIVAALVVVIFMRLDAKYHISDNLRSESCYTIMNVQIAGKCGQKTLALRGEKNQSMNHVQNVTNLVT